MTRLIKWLLAILAVNGVWCKGKIRKFPKEFLFGVSTSAYQTEGAWNEDGKSMSIWDVATHSHPSPISDGSSGDIATDSYHQYQRDIEMIKELGVDIYRFSISWSRILPNGFPDKINDAGVQYYRNLINGLLDNNIKPFVTIYHWDLPETLQKLGGWLNSQIADWFADYAKVLFELFGDKVKLWITINEPLQICCGGYGSDLQAPFLNHTGIAEYICAKNLLLAHAKAYHIYDEMFRKKHNGKIGISISCTWFEPSSPSNDDVQAAQDARMFYWGIYTHPIFSKSGDFPHEVRMNVAAKSAEQGYPRSRLPELSAQELSYIRGTADFFGMNSYTSKYVYRDASLEGMFAVPSYDDDMAAVRVKDPSWNQAQSSWLQEVPWGFYKMLKEVKKLYGNPPLYVTENGWSTSGGLLDDGRIRYMRNYLNAMLDAIDDGSDIRMYLAWSLMDNFEWKNGYTDKFGLYEVDFTAPERTRTPRKSAFVFKEIVRSNRLDPNYEPNYAVEKYQRKLQNKDDDVF